LAEVEESLRKIKTVSNGNPKEVQELLSSIHINKSLEKEWDNFTDYFGSVHVGFYEKFNGLFPNVTLSEKRLAGLIRMNMTNSEIAGILNIESSSVKTAKYRLKKKVGLNDEQDIHSFLQTF
jgi:DNA-binding NarL/FixJ family response regulator